MLAVQDKVGSRAIDEEQKKNFYKKNYFISYKKKMSLFGQSLRSAYLFFCISTIINMSHYDLKKHAI